MARLPDSTMQLELTAIFHKVPEGYIGFIEELPGANTQGATLDEARENLREAAHLVIDANRELVTKVPGLSDNGDVIREPLRITAA
jgi:predicted RNase H-like HicB family nuclease